MIIKEEITINGVVLTKTYSDKFKIKKVGTNEIYDEAIDIKSYKYEETEELLEKDV